MNTIATALNKRCMGAREGPESILRVITRTNAPVGDLKSGSYAKGNELAKYIIK